MILISQFRRQLWDDERCDRSWTRHSLVACALVCHKGDASQSQSNQQTGAQSGGTVVSGNEGPVKALTASNNTGSPVANYDLNLSKNGDAGFGNTNVTNVSLTDLGAVDAAMQESQSALDAISQANEGALKSNATLANTISATAQNITNAGDSIKNITKEVATIAALGICLWLGYKIFKRS